LARTAGRTARTLRGATIGTLPTSIVGSVYEKKQRAGSISYSPCCWKIGAIGGWPPDPCSEQCCCCICACCTRFWLGWYCPPTQLAFMATGMYLVCPDMGALSVSTGRPSHCPCVPQTGPLTIGAINGTGTLPTIIIGTLPGTLPCPSIGFLPVLGFFLGVLFRPVV
jgi:hypothetical protein